MNTKDIRYFRRRAEAEIEAATNAETTAACQAHYELAEAYLERVYPEGEEESGEADAPA